MRIEKGEPGFTPITIVVETQEEAEVIGRLLYSTGPAGGFTPDDVLKETSAHVRSSLRGDTIYDLHEALMGW